MRCHYEVLGIERNADDKAIKNAYRKLALKYHPDKNLDNIDAAKEQFLLVQQAYDVLSDLQERAWYDNHREQILRGSQSDYEDESLDVYPYFTAACYKGFGDDDDGFYAVYAKLFDQIATEDIEFMDSPDEYEEIPKFGTSTSDYDTCVGPFYAYWQSYCTKKTYTWLCPHNINEIRDRRILREVEKETKKIAQKKRKERNEEIRALVAFVRKRDKRVHEYRKVLEAKAEQNRQKQQQHRLAQLRKNQQAVREMQENQDTIAFKLAADHEEQLRQLEQAYTDSDSEWDDDDDDEEEDGDDDDVNDEKQQNGDDNHGDSEAAATEMYYIDDLYCVACNKAFKNVLSFENHESSKKHRENTERLRKQMQEDDEQYRDESDNLSNENDENDLAKADSEIASDAGAASGAAATTSDPPPKKPNKKSKKSKKRNTQPTHKITDDSDTEHELADVKDSIANVAIGGVSDADKDAWSDDGGGKKKKKAKNKKSTKKSTPQADGGDSVEQNGDITAPSTTKGAGNKKGKKTIDAVNATATASKLNNSTDVDHTCVTCHSIFQSKNKLFTHLKKTNHGVYIPKSTEEPKSTNKRK